MDAMKPNFKFRIQGDFFLTPDGLQSLSLLYQPIIGVDAFSLYHILFNLPRNIDLRHSLMLNLTCGNMLGFTESRHRLEGAGLLDVYEANELATYVLKEPLGISRFLTDPIMRAFLYVKIGTQDFNCLRNNLIPSPGEVPGVKNTKRFDEVYDVRPLSRIEQIEPFRQNTGSSEQGIKIDTVIDVDLLERVLDSKGISREIVTAELISILNDFAFLYKFDIHELARLVFDSSLPDASVDFSKMRAIAKNQFQIMSKGENVQVVVKKEEEKAREATVSNGNKIIPFMEQNPIDFLQFKSGGKPPVPADIRLVEWLYVDQQMPAGVVNVLVDYVLNYADGTLPKALIEKIAGQWQRQGVATTEAAMGKVGKVLAKSNNYQKEKAKPISKSQGYLKKNATRIEPIPDWLGQVDTKPQNEDEQARIRIEEMKKMMLGGANNA